MPVPCKSSPEPGALERPVRSRLMNSGDDWSAAHQHRSALKLRGGPHFPRIDYFYSVAIKPFAVAISIQGCPERTIESIRPTPGTVSPRVTVETPSGPSRIAVAPRTSRTVQPSIVVGLVSGTATIGSRGGSEAALEFVGTTGAVREDAPAG